MKTFTFLCCLFMAFSAFSQKTLDSIRHYTAEQGEFTKDFTRQYFVNTSDSVIEYEDRYIANSEVYNKKYLRVGKYDSDCKPKFSTYTVSDFDQFSQKYKITSRFYDKYDQNCNLSQFIYYDFNKLDTFLVAYYDLYDDKGNPGSEIDYYDFDGNGLKKISDNKISYKYNSQNKLIESTIEEYKNGKYIITSKRILEYNNEGKVIKNQFSTVDTSGNEQVTYKSSFSYFNGGSVVTTFFLDYLTKTLYPATIDSTILDNDDDPTYSHAITKNTTGEVVNNDKHYYYYSGSSATTTTSLDPDISINNFICVEGMMYFMIENPKGKKMDITVSDISGRLIYKNEANESMWHSPQINISDGMYILKVETKDGIKGQKKIAH